MKRMALAALALFAVYVVLSFGNDTRGYLGTDTGGKVATLRAMDRRGDFDPDVGYWAQRWDPNGRVHPLYYTSHIGHRWVNVTTLPALLAAAPLYRALGYRGALVLPMLGAVACALAAAALLRRLRPGDDGLAAFWIVGLASPMLIYALDFWEHTLGVALMAWAVVVLVDLATRARAPWWGVVAGLLLGAAATMRTEAFLYAFVATAVVCLVLVRRFAVAAVSVGLLVVVGFAIPVAANTALEHAVLGQSFRTARAQNTVSSAGEVTSSSRVREAALTSVASTSDGDTASLLLGAGVVVAVALAVTRRDVRAVYFAVALLATRTLAGLDFVPGFLVAAPLGVGGLAGGWRRGPPARIALAVGVVALPLVWSFQYTGGAGPQWGGRYVLVSSFLLTVVGIGVLATESAQLRRALFALAAVVTALGLAWMYVRTHAIADAERRLDALPAPVRISRVAHLVREGGGELDLDHWLTAATDRDLAKAAAVANAAGARRIAVVDLAGSGEPSRLGAYRVTGRMTRVELLPGIFLEVRDYELDAAKRT